MLLSLNTENTGRERQTQGAEPAAACQPPGPSPSPLLEAFPSSFQLGSAPTHLHLPSAVRVLGVPGHLALVPPAVPHCGERSQVRQRRLEPREGMGWDGAGSPQASRSDVFRRKLGLPETREWEFPPRLLFLAVTARREPWKPRSDQRCCDHTLHPH